MCEIGGDGVILGMAAVMLFLICVSIFGGMLGKIFDWLSKPGSFQRIDIEHRERNEREKRRRGDA